MASEAQVVELPAELGTLTVYSPDGSGANRSLFGVREPHARLSDGRTVVWNPPTGQRADGGNCIFVVDAEWVDPGPPAGVAERLGCSGPGAALRWTQLEVVAKATGVPVHILLAGGAPPPIPTTSLLLGNLAVSLAVLPCQPSLDISHRRMHAVD